MRAIASRLRRLEERLGPQVANVDAGGAKERILEKIARMAERRGSGEDLFPEPTLESVQQRLQEWVRGYRERTEIHSQPNSPAARYVGSGKRFR
jgi:hypothetical protein